MEVSDTLEMKELNAVLPDCDIYLLKGNQQSGTLMFDVLIATIIESVSDIFSNLLWYLRSCVKIEHMLGNVNLSSSLNSLNCFDVV